MVGNLIQIMSHLPFLPGFINLASYFLLCSTLVNYTYMPKFSCTIFISTTSFCKDFIYLFLEKGREGERKSEKQQCVVDSCMPPTGDLACKPGMCPDWELNQ